MAYKKVVRKAKVGVSVIREHGLLSFSIMSLQFLQKHTSKHKASHAIHTKASYSDVIAADFSTGLVGWKGTDRKVLRFNWLMPPPGKGSGGHFNIFRFIKFLEDAGHECRIYLYVNGSHGPISGIVSTMGSSYPKLKSQMQWLENDEEMEEADGIFATSWETAYPVFNSKLDARKFYFVQDFEPYFYPVGSLYVLAENTYKFGLYGITAGGWLSKKLKSNYGMSTDSFDFGSDENLYSFDNTAVRKEVFCYVRPYTERRGFELAVMALDLFHRKHPDYAINLAGWDVSEYDIPFPYNNLKTLELSELNGLYNQCAAGLVISLTNMSLLPLELLGSGTIPVVNDGENNRLVSNNPYIAYANNDPVSLAAKLSEVVSRRDPVEYAKKAADSVKATSWQKSGDKFVSIVERETRGQAS